MPTSHRPPPLRQFVNASTDARRRPQIVSWPPRQSPLRSTLYSEDGGEPNSPASPAVLGTASIWSPIPGIAVQVVDVVPPNRSPLGRSMGSPSILDREDEPHHRYAWVRKRSQHTPSFPFGLRSPFLQCVISFLTFTASLTTFSVLFQSPGMNRSLEIVLVLLAILSGILLVHGAFRMYLSRKNSYVLRQERLQNRKRSHVRRRPRHLELRYSDPASPFDVLPGDDSPYTPTTPVRVHLLRDEEAFLDEKDTEEAETPTSAALPTPPPPAYGLWKCSVRADPNLLYWERAYGTKNECAVTTEMVQVETIGTVTSVATRRPPSYRSEHGDVELLDVEAEMGLAYCSAVEIVDSGSPLQHDHGAAEEARQMLRLSMQMM